MHSYIHNYGIILIYFVKLFFFPLDATSYPHSLIELSGTFRIFNSQWYLRPLS